MAAKRDVLQKLESGLMEIPIADDATPKKPWTILKRLSRRNPALDQKRGQAVILGLVKQSWEITF